LDIGAIGGLAIAAGATGIGRGTTARGAIGAIGAIDGAAVITGTLDPEESPLPRKPLTCVSTSWLIEMLLVSQNDFSRSYVVRLTLMLRRVCFLAMIHP
jgi:hypothetical protein